MASPSEPLPRRCLRLEAAFPRLAAAGYTITSPRTADYNCIAFAAGDTNAWWWPLDPDAVRSSQYWPADCADDESLDAFRAAFATLGYHPCPDAALEPGFEKVALFAHRQSPTHAARQLPTGRWTSKIGPSYDVEHPLDALEGTEYGTVALILRRPTNG
jgi:hypothetical protein